MFLGVLCGVTLYMITLSKIFIKINVCILTFIKQIISLIIEVFNIPIKIISNILKKVIFNPILFIFAKLSKTFKEYVKKH